MTLEEKHLQAILVRVDLNLDNIEPRIKGRADAAKESAKITLQHCIDVLKDIGNPSSFNKETTYGFLKMKLLDIQQQLSDLNK